MVENEQKRLSLSFKNARFFLYKLYISTWGGGKLSKTQTLSHNRNTQNVFAKIQKFEIRWFIFKENLLGKHRHVFLAKQNILHTEKERKKNVLTSSTRRRRKHTVCVFFLFFFLFLLPVTNKWSVWLLNHLFFFYSQRETQAGGSIWHPQGHKKWEGQLFLHWYYY